MNPESRTTRKFEERNFITLDKLPIIGKHTGLQNVFLNIGHGKNLHKTIFASSELIVNLILNQSSILSPLPFRVDRHIISQNYY